MSLQNEVQMSLIDDFKWEEESLPNPRGSLMRVISAIASANSAVEISFMSHKVEKDNRVSSPKEGKICVLY